MKKLGLLIAVLAVIAALGTSAYSAGKKGAKLTTVKGTVTAVDSAYTRTFTLAEADGAKITFKTTTKVAAKLMVGEKVTVGYRALANGEKDVAYVKPEGARGGGIRWREKAAAPVQPAK